MLEPAALPSSLKVQKQVVIQELLERLEVTLVDSEKTDIMKLSAITMLAVYNV